MSLRLYWLPIAGLLFLSAVTLGLLPRAILESYSTSISADLERMSSQELSSGNVFDTSVKFNQLIANDHVKCVSAYSGSTTFFERGSCTAGFMTQQLQFTGANNLTIKLIVGLPSRVQHLVWLFASVQLASLLLVIWSSVAAERKQNEAVIQIAAQVSHDIRSPLAVLDMTLADIGEVPAEKLSMMRNAIRRIDEIASDLLKREKSRRAATQHTDVTGRDTPGSPQPDTSGSISIGDLIHQTANEKRIEWKRIQPPILLNEVISETSKELRTEIPTKDLSRILSNLLNNSKEALESSSQTSKQIALKLNAESETSRNLFTIEVADNGPGIPKHVGKTWPEGRKLWKNRRLGPRTRPCPRDPRVPRRTTRNSF